MFKIMEKKKSLERLSAQNCPSRREGTEISTPEPTFKKQDYVGAKLNVIYEGKNGDFTS